MERIYQAPLRAPAKPSASPATNPVIQRCPAGTPGVCSGSCGHTLSALSLGDAAPPGTGAVQMDKKRRRGSQYTKVGDYKSSSKFRFIRFRRRALAGMTSKPGINMFTVKYKKAGVPYYLTTRSVPSTATSFKVKPGHSEQRFAALRAKFEQRHKLARKHFQWGATEREPCGLGPGMADCRQTLGTQLGIPPGRVHFAFPYPDREDMRAHAHETPSALNAEASRLRERHNDEMETDVRSLRTDVDSSSASESDDDVVDEYESDYDEKPSRRRKGKGVPGAFREGRYQ